MYNAKGSNQKRFQKAVYKQNKRNKKIVSLPYIGVRF
jgi:hypothetical protein